MWHVSSRSGEATLRTAIHLLLTYLQQPGSMHADTDRRVAGLWIVQTLSLAGWVTGSYIAVSEARLE